LNSLPAFAAIISQLSDDVRVAALLMAKTVSCRQSMLWFTWRVVFSNFLLERHTVNEKYYCALLSN